MTLTLINYSRLSTLILMGVLVFFACFLIPVPRVHAEELTEEQVQAVLNLLSSFNADKKAIAGVEASLRGKGEIEAFNKQQKDDDDEADDNEDDDSDEDEDDSSNDEKKKEEIKTKTKMRMAPICPRFTKLLWRGMRDTDPDNPEVKELQKFLANHYGISEEDVATGYFGPVTHWLLVGFQEEEGLPAQGFAGELTRGKILKYCLHQSSENSGKGNAKDAASAAPRCVLKADKKEVDAGETVTLKWESTNATYASMPDGTKGPTHGSLQVTPEESTLYQKKVYGPWGEGSCTAEVEVRGEDENTGDDNALPIEVVVRPQGDSLSQIASAVMGVASMPFWIATDALTNIFLDLGIR